MNGVRERPSCEPPEALSTYQTIPLKPIVAVWVAETPFDVPVYVNESAVVFPTFGVYRNVPFVLNVVSVPWAGGVMIAYVIAASEVSPLDTPTTLMDGVAGATTPPAICVFPTSV